MCNLTAIGFILSVSQSVGQHVHAESDTVSSSRQGLAFVLLQSLGLFLMSCEKCLFFMWHAGGGGAGGGGGGRAAGWGQADSCFPSAFEPSGRPVVAWESNRAKLKEVKIPPIRKSSQFVPLYPRPHQCLRRTCPAQRTNPQPEVKDLPPSGSDYAFSSQFSIFSPQCNSAVILSLCWLSSFGLLRFWSSSTPSVIQDWLHLRALIHTLTHCSSLQKQILDGDCRYLLSFLTYTTFF